jgi:hypothetical protein
MDIRTFLYIMDNVKNDLQDCSNFRKCTEVEEKLTVALRSVLVIVPTIDIIYSCRILNAVKIQCKIKGNYTRKIIATLYSTKPQIYKHKHTHQ